MAEAWKSSGVIAGPEPPGGTAYRVIGADGVERSMSDLSDWIVAIRSGAVEPGSLFLDHETQRWRPVSDLDIFDEAKQAEQVSEARHRSNGAKPESGQSAIQGSGSGSENLAKRARNSALIWAISAAVLLIAFTAWAKGSALVAAVQMFIRQAPEPVRIGGAAVLFVILAEEFYWFSLMMVRVGSTSFARRFVLQVLSLLAGCVLLYAAFALFSTGGFQPNVRFFARNAGVVGVAYAVSLLLWSMLLLREPDATAAKKALASILASAMLAGTFYMAVAPSVRREAQTDIQNVSDAGPQVVPTVPASMAPPLTRMTPTPSGIAVPSPLRVSIPPTPTRVMSAPPPAGMVLRFGEKPLRLCQPSWAECGLGPAQAKPEEEDG
jgi:hypothetical protein